MDAVLGELADVDEIYEGVALEVHTGHRFRPGTWELNEEHDSSHEYNGVGDDYIRAASCWEIEQKPGVWRTRLYDEHFGRRGEHFGDYHEYTEEGAIKVCKDWVIG